MYGSLSVRTDRSLRRRRGEGPFHSVTISCDLTGVSCGERGKRIRDKAKDKVALALSHWWKRCIAFFGSSLRSKVVCENVETASAQLRLVLVVRRLDYVYIGQPYLRLFAPTTPRTRDGIPKLTSIDSARFVRQRASSLYHVPGQPVRPTPSRGTHLPLNGFIDSTSENGHILEAIDS